MSKQKMTKEAARRIQSHADRTGTNQRFKAAAMSAADRNVNQQAGQNGKGGDEG